MKRFFSLMLVAVAAISMAKADQLVVDCGGQATITATPETGYHFVRWNDDNTENPRVITPTADATYTAYFAINQYTIIFQNLIFYKVDKLLLIYFSNTQMILRKNVCIILSLLIAHSI